MQRINEVVALLRGAYIYELEAIVTHRRPRCK